MKQPVSCLVLLDNLVTDNSRNNHLARVISNHIAHHTTDGRTISLDG